jgi:hypothetical protein
MSATLTAKIKTEQDLAAFLSATFPERFGDPASRISYANKLFTKLQSITVGDLNMPESTGVRYFEEESFVPRFYAECDDENIRLTVQTHFKSLGYNLSAVDDVVDALRKRNLIDNWTSILKMTSVVANEFQGRTSSSQGGIPLILATREYLIQPLVAPVLKSSVVKPVIAEEHHQVTVKAPKPTPKKPKATPAMARSWISHQRLIIEIPQGVLTLTGKITNQEILEIARKLGNGWLITGHLKAVDSAEVNQFDEISTMVEDLVAGSCFFVYSEVSETHYFFSLSKQKLNRIKNTLVNHFIGT